MRPADRVRRLRGRGCVASRERRHRDRAGGEALAGDCQPAPGHGRGGVAGGGPGRAVCGRRAAVPGGWRREVSGGASAALPVPRPAAREAAAEHGAAREHHRLHPPADDRGRVQRVSDADPDQQQSGGRARLPGAGAAAPRQVLRAAAGAAAVQAALHGCGLRPLFPDRALLPRRGRAGGPHADVLPARRGDELRHAGRRVRGHGAGDGGDVPGVRGRAHGRCLMRRRCSTTAPTSRICAIRSLSAT